MFQSLKRRKYSEKNIQENPIEYNIGFILKELGGILNPLGKSDTKRTHDENSHVLKNLINSEEFPEELKEIFEETRKAIDGALKRNSLNIGSNILDTIPLGILSNPTSRLALLGIIGLIVSFTFSIIEYRYRKNVLNPKLKELIDTYEKETGTHVQQDIKLGNLDTIFDGAETIAEIISFLAPNIVIPSFLAPFIEIPLDSNSRKKYFLLMNELSELVLETKKEVS